MSVSVISLNTRELGDGIKRSIIFDYYRKRADVICLQETHSSEQTEKIWQTEWGSKAFFSHGTTNARGVCILIKKDLDFSVGKVERDVNGRIIIIELQSNADHEKKLTICNIYAPNRDSPNFFLDCARMLEHFSKNQMIIGDFNLVMNPSIDRKGESNNNSRSHSILMELMEQMEMCEIWRIRNEDSKIFSWMRTRPVLQASRIDYGLVTNNIASSVLLTMYLPGIKSDHLAFFISVEIVESPRGSGYWKLNNKHMGNVDFVTKINESIACAKTKMNAMDPMEKWEFLKQEVIAKAKEESKRIAMDKSVIISQLSEKIIELENKVAKNKRKEDIDLLLNPELI